MTTPINSPCIITGTVEGTPEDCTFKAEYPKSRVRVKATFDIGRDKTRIDMHEFECDVNQYNDTAKLEDGDMVQVTFIPGGSEYTKDNTRRWFNRNNVRSIKLVGPKKPQDVSRTEGVAFGPNDKDAPEVDPLEAMFKPKDDIPF